MVAPKRERFENFASSALDGGISDSDTDLDVDDASSFPADGRFRILIGSEIIIVNTVTSNNFSGLERGAEGTVAASHSSSDPVYGIMTSGALESFGRQNMPCLWSNSMPLNKLTDTDGETLLLASDFTWVNQDGASATDEGGSILLRCLGNNGHDGNPSLNILARAYSDPITLTAAFQVCAPVFNSNDEAAHFGIGFRETSSGKIVVIMWVNQAHGEVSPGDGTSKLQVRNWDGPTDTTPTTIRDEHAVARLCSPVLWLRIEDDSADFHFYVGLDPDNMVLIHTVARDSHLDSEGPGQIFWYGQTSSYDNDSLFRLVHWSTE